MDHVNTQDFSGFRESLSLYPGSLLQPLGPAWALRECTLGQDKLLAALALLSAFRLAAHDDFVPVNVSPRLEAMQSLGILSIRRVSLLATGGRKMTSFIARNPPPVTPFGPAALQGDRPGPSLPSPAFRVSSPPLFC